MKSYAIGMATLAVIASAMSSTDGTDASPGAELVHRSSNPKLVAAIGDWFDAQSLDHGHDAVAGPVRHEQAAFAGTRMEDVYPGVAAEAMLS